MEERFEIIVAQLREEEARLRRRQEELSAELQWLQADLKRAQTAISALISESAGSPTKKKRERPLGATRKQVTSLVVEVLKDLGALDEERLRSEVESRLKDKRISRVGFTARFREALGDGQFREGSQGWRLIEREDLEELDNVSH